MTDRDALVAAILADPEDDLPRLIYADWCEEQGDLERAEFVRVQCELSAIDRRPERDPWPASRFAELRRRERELWGYLVRDAHDNHAGKLWGLPAEQCTVPGPNAPESYPHDTYIVRRGFVAEVRCPLQAWLEHGPAVVRAHPVERVGPSDCKPLCHTGALRRVHTWAGGAHGPTTPYHIPPEVFSLLDWYEAGPSDHSHGYYGWDTEREALDALSDALLLGAKSRAAP